MAPSEKSQGFWKRWGFYPLQRVFNKLCRTGLFPLIALHLKPLRTELCEPQHWESHGSFPGTNIWGSHTHQPSGLGRSGEVDQLAASRSQHKKAKLLASVQSSTGAGTAVLRRGKGWEAHSDKVYEVASGERRLSSFQPFLQKFLVHFLPATVRERVQD